MKLSIILISDETVNRDYLKSSVEQLGNRVINEIDIGTNFLQSVESYVPDLMIIYSNAITERFLSQLTLLSEKQPLPVVVFTENENREMMQKAIKAGVTTYIYDGMQPHRLGSIIEVAMSRFQISGQLRQQLAETKLNLSDRKNIERAKGLLMKQKNIDESEAYHTLRKMAMDKNVGIGQVSEYVISVADLLN